MGVTRESSSAFEDATDSGKDEQSEALGENEDDMDQMGRMVWSRY